MFTIDHDLKEYIESGVACLVGSGDRQGRPHIAQGWGPRVGEDGTSVDVFIDRPRSDRTLENLRENPRIAMTVAHPVTYRSVQLKGRYCDTGAPGEDDLAWVHRHRDEFLVSTTLIGDPPETIRKLWLDDVVRVSFDVERAFDQTPGPDAGKPL